MKTLLEISWRSWQVPDDPGADQAQQKQPPERFYKKLFLKISKKRQKNNCVGVSVSVDITD